jgi:hypothetical protein
MQKPHVQRNVPTLRVYILSNDVHVPDSVLCLVTTHVIFGVRKVKSLFDISNSFVIFQRQWNGIVLICSNIVAFLSHWIMHRAKCSLVASIAML